MRIRIASTLVALAIALLPLGASTLVVGKPEEAGFSPERLARVREAVKRHLDAGSPSGAVTLVARRGKIVHHEAHGLMDVESKKAMPKDGIFRLASTSKPITAAALLMMVEEGKVRLADPVSRFIPEFKSMKVAVPRPGGSGKEFDTVPAAREITVRDLLTHGSGVMSGGPSGAAAPRREANDTLATYLPKLAEVPLDFQPGTLWRYSGQAGFDMLSRIVEIASGMPYDRFLRERLFDPLGMKDTGFYAPPDRAARLVTLYRRTPEGKLERTPDQSGLSSTTYFAGSGGMVSTAEDYAKFAQMMLNGGELNGRRYLGPRTVQMMITNHTGDMVNGQFGRPARGMGFGLGVQINEDTAASGLPQSKGAWGWAGGFGTNFNVEPAEQMVTVVFIQTPNGALQRDVETAIRQAIVD
jgi:CubicO group peptidase (beta-lactamase class C family)